MSSNLKTGLPASDKLVSKQSDKIPCALAKGKKSVASLPFNLKCKLSRLDNFLFQSNESHNHDHSK